MKQFDIRIYVNELKTRNVVKCKSVLNNKPIQEICELKYLWNVISPEGEGHLKNNTHTFIHIREII
jgi:hypothetical protein